MLRGIVTLNTKLRQYILFTRMDNKDKLLIEERRNEIVKYIDKVEKATIEDIINHLKISRSTVRRDLIDLERKNLIIRTRGGALKKKYFKY